MVKKLILRGVLAGAIAGLLAFVFARIFAEPIISRAIDYETARDDALAALAGGHAHGAEHEVFSRSIQANLGIGAGMILFGAAMGALVAVVYCVCLGRVGNLRARTLAVLVPAGGFLTVFLVPFLKYPASPPSIGHEDTIRQRSGLYLILVLASVLLLIAAVWAGQKLKPRFGNWNATLLASLVFIIPIGALMFALPEWGHLADNLAEYGRHATETPQPITDADGKIILAGFNADELFGFRMYSVGAQLLLWGTIALIFAPLADRVLRDNSTPQNGQKTQIPAVV